MTRGIKVLYVEDEPAIAELLRSGLELFGIDVSPIYGNAEEAFQTITSGQPPMSECQLLVFDIRLPGMTGLDLAAKLRDANEKRPILIVSAYQPPARAQLEALRLALCPSLLTLRGLSARFKSY